MPPALKEGTISGTVYSPLAHVENMGWLGEMGNLRLDLVPR